MQIKLQSISVTKGEHAHQLNAKKVESNWQIARKAAENAEAARMAAKAALRAEAHAAQASVY